MGSVGLCSNDIGVVDEILAPVLAARNDSCCQIRMLHVDTSVHDPYNNLGTACGNLLPDRHDIDVSAGSASIGAVIVVVPLLGKVRIVETPAAKPVAFLDADDSRNAFQGHRSLRKRLALVKSDLVESMKAEFPLAALPFSSVGNQSFHRDNAQLVKSGIQGHRLGDNLSGSEIAFDKREHVIIEFDDHDSGFAGDILRQNRFLWILFGIVNGYAVLCAAGGEKSQGYDD